MVTRIMAPQAARRVGQDRDRLAQATAGPEPLTTAVTGRRLALIKPATRLPLDGNSFGTNHFHILTATWGQGFLVLILSGRPSVETGRRRPTIKLK